MDNKLFVSRYLVGLPTAKQLSRFVEQDRARIEALTNTSPSALDAKTKRLAARPARKK